jgi:hypothetical protein
LSLPTSDPGPRAGAQPEPWCSKEGAKHARQPVKMMLDAAFGRPQPPGRAGGVDAAVLQAVAEAALAWWRSRRPRGWSLEQHLADPMVHCEGDHERRLAEAVARWTAPKQ